MEHNVDIEEKFVDREMPGLGKLYRLVCACGETWPWRQTWKAAQDDELIHVGGDR